MADLGAIMGDDLAQQSQVGEKKMDEPLKRKVSTSS